MGDECQATRHQVRIHPFQYCCPFTDKPAFLTYSCPATATNPFAALKYKDDT